MSNIIVPKSKEVNLQLNKFSDKLSLSKNIKIINNADGTESLTISFDDKVLTFIIDNSGSMTWNDYTGQRFILIKHLIDYISNNYNGNVFYNIISYGAEYVSSLFFATVHSNVDIPIFNSVQDIFTAGLVPATALPVRVVRNIRREINGEIFTYPRSPSDGEVVADGFISAAIDEDLTTGEDYFYTVYTYDSQGQFSSGQNIQVTPKLKNIPRGISNFIDVFETSEPFIGKGVPVDDYTSHIWHIDEGIGKLFYDFVGGSPLLLNNLLSENNWMSGSIVGDYFYAFSNEGVFAESINEIQNLCQSEKTFTFWVRLLPYNLFSVVDDFDKSYVIASQLTDDGDLIFAVSYFIDASEPKNAYLQVHISENIVYRTIEPVLDFENWFNLAICLQFESNGLLSDDSGVYIDGIFYEINKIVDDGLLVYNNGKFYLGGINFASQYSSFGQFRGYLSDFVIHSIFRDEEYINGLIVSHDSVQEFETIVVDDDLYLSGQKDDNGDRISAFKFFIPYDHDCPYLVSVVRKPFIEPTWYGDGDVVFSAGQSILSTGWNYFLDSDFFIPNIDYYYKIYVLNEDGNYSYSEDSAVARILSTGISAADAQKILLEDFSEINITDIENLQTFNGINQILLRWEQSEDIGDAISTRIYFDKEFFPKVKHFGNHSGKLIFTGTVDQNYFIFNDLEVDEIYYFSVVNEDRYGRVSSSACAIGQTGFAYRENEKSFPVSNITGLKSEIICSDQISLYWDSVGIQSASIVAGYNDVVSIYSQMNNVFGQPLDLSLIDIEVEPQINFDNQFDVIFGSLDTPLIEEDAYSFITDKKSNGLVVGALRLSRDNAILSRIKDAAFRFKIRSVIPNLRYLSSNLENDLSMSNFNDNSRPEYIESSFFDIQNIYEYKSRYIDVKFDNPWKIKIINRDGLRVRHHKCYYYDNGNLDRPVLRSITPELNGIYVGSSKTFVARAKITYAGEPVYGGSVRISIWDAEVDKCSCAGVQPPCEIGFTPLSPTSEIKYEQTLPIQRGFEDTVIDGEPVRVPISFVDITLRSPRSPMSVVLYVAGEYLGYRAIDKMNITFESTYRSEITSITDITPDNIMSRSLSASFYFIDPDFPDDKKKRIYPFGKLGQSIAYWNVEAKFADIARSIGMTEEVTDVDVIDRLLYSPDAIPSHTDGLATIIQLNGLSSRVFWGPFSNRGKNITEGYEILVSSRYSGMYTESRIFTSIFHNETIQSDYTSRFLMCNPEASGNVFRASKFYTDGIHFGKIEISRTPEFSNNLSAKNVFENCIVGSSVAELDNGQILTLSVIGADSFEGSMIDYSQVEFIWGKDYITESSSGLFIDEENANIYRGSSVNIPLEFDENIMTIYVRVNEECLSCVTCEPASMECNSVNHNLDCFPRLTSCDVVRMGNFFIRGETIVNIDGNLVPSVGGGASLSGLPPCGFCLIEPLRLYVGYINLDGTDITNSWNGNIITFPKYNSILRIRVYVEFAGEPISDENFVFVNITDDSGIGSLFQTLQSKILVETDSLTGETYADVTIVLRDIPQVNRTASVSIFSTYDKLNIANRKQSFDFSVFVVARKNEIEEPDVSDPSTDDVLVEHPLFMKDVISLDLIDRSNEWNMIGSLDVARARFYHSDEYNGKIVIAGGISSFYEQSRPNIILNTIISLDLTSNDIQVLGTITSSKFGGMSVTYDGYLYLIGGMVKDGYDLSPSDEIERINLDTGLSEIVGHLPYGIAFGAAFVDQSTGQCIVACGATRINLHLKRTDYQNLEKDIEKFSNIEYNDKILHFNIETISDFEIIEISSGVVRYKRIFPSVLASSDSIFMVGGYNETLIGDVADYQIAISDPSINNGVVSSVWSIDNRWSAGFSYDGNKNVIIGGENSIDGKGILSTAYYDNIQYNKIPNSLKAMGCILYDNKVYLIGGIRGRAGAHIV